MLVFFFIVIWPIFPVHLSSLVFWLCPSLLGFVELFKVLSSDPASWLSISVPVRLVTEVTYLCWLIVDIDLHPLPGADEGSGNLMVAGGFHTCCWWFLNMLMTISDTQTTPQFLYLLTLFSRVWSPLLHACWCVAVILSNLKSLRCYQSSHLLMLFRLSEIRSMGTSQNLWRYYTFCKWSLIHTFWGGVASVQRSKVWILYNLLSIT